MLTSKFAANGKSYASLNVTITSPSRTVRPLIGVSTTAMLDSHRVPQIVGRRNVCPSQGEIVFEAAD